MKTTTELLNQIRTVAGGRLGAAEIERILDEVHAHLDASIHARLELGVSHQEAEGEAVAAFGDARLFVRALTGQNSRPRVWHGLVLGFLVAVSIVMFCGPMFKYDLPYQECTAIALITACVVAAIQGWRWSRVSVKALALAAATSITVGMSTVSAIYIAQPEDGSIYWTRRELSHFTLDPDIYLAGQRASLATLVSKKLAEFDSHKPPYRIPRSTLVTENGSYVTEKNSYRIANSRREAIRMLSAYKAKVEATWPRNYRMLELNNKSTQEQLSTPFALNTLRIWPTVRLPALYLWIIVATCHILGGLSKRAFGLRVRSRLLLSPVLEIGIDHNDAPDVRHATDLSIAQRLIASGWIDRRVSFALAAFVLLTAISFPLDRAGIISVSIFILGTLFIGWLSLSAKRPQVIPLVGAFLLGSIAYLLSFGLAQRASQPDPFIHQSDALPACAIVILMTGSFSAVCWFSASLWRGLRKHRSTTM